MIIQYLKVFHCIINTILSLGMPKFMNDQTSTAIFIAYKALVYTSSVSRGISSTDDKGNVSFLIH